MMISLEQLQNILEAAIMVAGRPLSLAQMQKLFDEGHEPELAEIKNALQILAERYANTGIELKEIASGYQFQARTSLSPWLSKLWEERPQKYSRALLETLALIAYRQPITRSEVEDIRGVTVSSHITKTLLEREWIRVIGYRDVPGKPALYGTTKTFLDHFNLKTLDELPILSELNDLEKEEAKLHIQLELSDTDETHEQLEIQTTLSEEE
jgi:segregation and condensation protein B